MPGVIVGDTTFYLAFSPSTGPHPASSMKARSRSCMTSHARRCCTGCCTGLWSVPVAADQVNYCDASLATEFDGVTLGPRPRL